jgi:hypothetical protein
MGEAKPTVRPEHQHLVDNDLLPSPNTAPGTPHAAFMPDVLSPGPDTMGQYPIGDRRHFEDHQPSVDDWTGHQVAEPYQGATQWTSPTGEEWLVDPATGRITEQFGGMT